MASGDRTPFAQRFRAVARERLAKARSLLASLAQGDGATDEAEELRREIHSLKGEARVVGFPAIAQALHEIESALVAEPIPGAALVAALGPGLDGIEDLLHARDHTPADAPHAGAPSVPAAPGALERIARQASESFLRVDLASISLLGRAIGDLRVGEAEQARFVDDLAELAERARDAERRGEASSAATELVLALRHMASRARQIAFDQHARLDRLEDGIRAVRMVPLATLFEPFPRAARELAEDLGKEIDVLVLGGDVEVDRQVLDVIAEPLLHLVRNAIDHGIETPAARAAAGKRERGTLALRARTSGSNVTIEIEDDGRGVDLEALAAALRDRGEASVDPEELDDAGVLDLLCRHGLSTRRDVSEISGRGLGLDVVKRRTESVGGRLGLRTERGIGTTFALEVPSSAVLATMVCALADGVRYAFAPADVEALVALAGADLERAGSGPILRVESRPVPFADLAALVGGRRADGSPRAAAIVLARSGRRLALGVDRLVGALSVLQQRLDPFLERAAVVRSVALSTDGDLAIALDVDELFRRAEIGVTASAPGPAPRRAGSRAHRVLVVDDSELTRDVVVSVLRDMGLEVIEAVNGARAAEMLPEVQPDLVVTDLDMPLVDGFELLRHIRADPSRATLPIVVLSTRGASDDVKRASELGADAYLVKNGLELDHLRRVVTAQLRTRST